MSFASFNHKQPVIFSDFDGTITERDVIIMIMERFAPPQWREITDQILNQRTLTIREGVAQLFQLIPGTCQAEIEEFVAENVVIRKGFEGFLDFCRANNTPFLVLSGGIDFFVRPVLAPFGQDLSIFCNGAKFSPEEIEVTTPYLNLECPSCGQCGCCKIGIMDRYDPLQYYRIAIGDSLTDLPMARCADLTFARGRLVDYCREETIPTVPYETFDDIQQALQERMVIPSCR